MWLMLFLICVLSGSPFAQDARGLQYAVPETERARLGFDADTSTALFVGVRSFEDDALSGVPFAVDDAVDLAHLFAVELALVTPGRVVLALSGDPQKDSSRDRLAALKQAGARTVPASKSKILQQLWRQSKAAGSDGLFLVGLATHGFTKAGQDYLFARDTLKAYPRETGIRVGLLFEALAKASTPRRFALLDACKERLGATRGIQAPAMSQAFHNAIAAAQGQVVLAATTTHGYAYDDTERRNGVFTAAILDGLRGAALDRGAPFVTAGTLADYVDKRVVEWVHQHRPSDHQTLGITRNIEGAGAALPLSADAESLERTQAYQIRKAKAVDKLKAHLGGPLTGRTYDDVVAFLTVDTPTEAHLELLDEINALDNTRRSKRGLAAYVDTYVTPLVGAPIPPKPQSARLTVRSNVVGDTVYVDERRYGPTGPSSIELTPGEHRVRVEKDGYGPWEERVVLGAGEQRTLRASLTWAPAPPRPTVPAGDSGREPTTGTDFVWIEGDCFQMGSPTTETGRYDDERQHRVCVEDFWLGSHEVTVGEFRRFVQATNYRTEAEREDGCYYWDGEWKKDKDRNWRSPGFEQGDRHPAVCVSWNDAQAYIDWLNRQGQAGFRLPSEAEWEYAARAKTQTARFWGEAPDDACQYANVADKTAKITYGYWTVHACTDGYVHTAPAGQFRPNPFGLYDLLGNVWEWTCSDSDADYGGAEKTCATKGNSGARRVVRGGGWSDDPRNVRSAYRTRGPPDTRFSNIGFRLARTP